MPSIAHVRLVTAAFDSARRVAWPAPAMLPTIIAAALLFRRSVIFTQKLIFGHFYFYIERRLHTQILFHNKPFDVTKRLAEQQAGRKTKNAASVEWRRRTVDALC